MIDLKSVFITTERPYREGCVEVFEQKIRVKDISRATLTITALGIYEAELNGVKVGDILFAPGYTYYPGEVQYQIYDVTNLMKGENTLRVYLGQGWYCGRFTFDNKTQIYGEKPAVAWILEIMKTDGSTETFTSSDNDVYAVASPYTYAGFYDGEVYDPDRADVIYDPVAYTGKLPEVFDETVISVKVQESLPVRRVIKNGDATILDFGQNFAGVLEIDPAKMHGEKLRIRHGEILDADGSLYTGNLRKAKAELIFNKGSETGKYRPRFTYMGFRYAEISEVEYTDGLVTAYAIYSEMKRTGEFSCENDLVQRLYYNQLWSQKSNYVDVPTDCPQRDERMGYTGDGHVFALTGAYNFDTEAFWKKFLRDIRFSQDDNAEGYVAPTIPAPGPDGIGLLSMLGWGNCDLIVPEMLYWQYGDTEHLAKQYDSMKKYVECEIRHMEGKDLWLAPNLGDWLTVGKGMEYMVLHNGPVSNAFIVNDLRILSETAALFDKTEDSGRYKAQLDKTIHAYMDSYVGIDGMMRDDYQGAYIMALKFVLPRGKLWDAVFNRLIEKLKKEGMQTGFFSTEHLLPLLAENGEEELAYDLLLNDQCPGWMYEVKSGATTIWERWDAIRPDGTINETEVSNGENMVSFNHYAFGSVGEFYYRFILGIRPIEPGYSRVRVAPVPDPRLHGVSGCYHSRKGEIHSAWKYHSDRLCFDITVPVPAEIILPGETVKQVEAGSYHYEISL